ncbi:hypothetical protein NL108_015979 [Boleophthalmus pectinirostris]|uniref:uncharacterized protein LOC110159259 isoform X1 n=2 Tax=Boleophthalmus pectinirostris TaxID=150288 RepID=UPI000A1C3BB3|nr:uncharacterized protein LOC110159259 isoform X1 [Boleophthalmus pectinirostris]KAJ0055327.1 hypothetical protein NL108_015979 [Boleophthalmus pectinirostris]
MQPDKQARANTKIWALLARRARGEGVKMGEAQSRSVMLQHQDPAAVDSAYSSSTSSSSLRNRKYQDQDGNSNFLSTTTTSPGNKDDENRNQIRPRNLGPLGRDPPTTNNPPGNYGNVLSPRSRMPCWTTLEPLPEIESGDDGYGRVPPDGAEEGKITEEEARIMMQQFEEKQREKLQAIQRRRSSLGLRGEDREEIRQMENADEWGDSGSDSEYSERSESMASLQLEGGGAEESPMERWDRIGVGETKSSLEKRQSLSANDYSSLLDDDEDQSSDSDGERGELLDAVWTLRDRERFKAQEMEKHQTQLTMYRRLALIRWVRTLQTRVQEQQNRLQSSFDLILTHRKELLRVGAAANVANAPPTAVGQS